MINLELIMKFDVCIESYEEPKTSLFLRWGLDVAYFLTLYALIGLWPSSYVLKKVKLVVKHPGLTSYLRLFKRSPTQKLS